MKEKFDVILVGSSFASSFFLYSYLEKASPTARILVLERGKLDPHRWQIENRKNSSKEFKDTFINNHPNKEWYYTPSFGGGSNCWWAVTPRFMPNDFRMKSVYGVGVDWPMSYDELETFYGLAERIMSVSGPDDGSPYPRSSPYPQPPHRFSNPDEVLKSSYPDLFFHQPTARARKPTSNRPQCCATSVCHLCPVDAKFSILNEMFYLYKDPRVTLQLEANVLTVETKGGLASGVSFLKNGSISYADADLIILGANAIFNPHIMQRSNITHPFLGKYLDEQAALDVNIKLDGLDNFQGSTSITGFGYMLYDGEHRKDYAACIIESWNVPKPRYERGKWQQRLLLKFVYENLPSENNQIKFDVDNPDLPETIYKTTSDYAMKGINKLPSLLPKLLKPLPIESLTISKDVSPTVYHILGTTVMGNDPQTSIVDKYLVHHKIRNLLVLGAGAFPTVSPANPSLTISALSLWAAHHLLT